MKVECRKLKIRGLFTPRARVTPGGSRLGQPTVALCASSQSAPSTSAACACRKKKNRDRSKGEIIESGEPRTTSKNRPPIIFLRSQRRHGANSAPKTTPPCSEVFRGTSRFAGWRAHEPDIIRLTRSDRICSPLPRLDSEQQATRGKISGTTASSAYSNQRCSAVCTDLLYKVGPNIFRLDCPRRTLLRRHPLNADH